MGRQYRAVPCLSVLPMSTYIECSSTTHAMCTCTPLIGFPVFSLRTRTEIQFEVCAEQVRADRQTKTMKSLKYICRIGGGGVIKSVRRVDHFRFRVDAESVVVFGFLFRVRFAPTQK